MSKLAEPGLSSTTTGVLEFLARFSASFWAVRIVSLKSSRRRYFSESSSALKLSLVSPISRAFSTFLERKIAFLCGVRSRPRSLPPAMRIILLSGKALMATSSEGEEAENESS